ncbi:GNAT family N-acetyltransferase [Cytobacillus dafuensis]|uniref:GNAT family N-acetyltransferase n=1 Tax=Cytobacillus dafuensis TaxID=1742359 RepID=A0A5B8Z149_CYTDA|nr:GNAT family N-acetyltransferase [Cytobacillus dafuensis]QED46588.1 GNAT family N-acetyltransferase [Cytobacillus dafuensis]
MIIRKAENQDSEVLSELAYKSKAYWGYSKEFIEKCKDDLTVTVQYMRENHVYVLEKDNTILAFYSLSTNPNRLDALFIDPDHIGKGIGKVLWEDLINKAKHLNMKEFNIDSDPNAEGYYLKMGAKRIGETPSTVFPNRSLPLMNVTVE